MLFDSVLGLNSGLARRHSHDIVVHSYDTMITPQHGRIAMFAFVGYIVHANGIHFPWAMQMDGTPFPSTTNAPEAWDSISDNAKWQIFGFIGFLEVVSHCMLCRRRELLCHLV